MTKKNLVNKKKNYILKIKKRVSRETTPIINLLSTLFIMVFIFNNLAQGVIITGEVNSADKSHIDTKKANICSMIPQNPIVTFTWSPQDPYVGELITFDASGCYDPDGGDINKWVWDWENDEINDACGIIKTHLYCTAGAYTVKLYVKDNEGESNILFHNITVKSNSNSQKTAESFSLPPDYSAQVKTFNYNHPYHGTIMNNWVYSLSNFLSTLSQNSKKREGTPGDKEVIEEPSQDQKKEETVIKVAICICRPVFFEDIIRALENYSWGVKNTYRFCTKIIKIPEIIYGELDNYDIFFAPGCNTPWIVGHIPILKGLWKKAIHDFLNQGKGYVGICGGAMAASLGYKEKKNNDWTLGIANVYLNCDRHEEMQYDFKEPFLQDLTGVPLRIEIRNKNHSILKGYPGEELNMIWHSGAGFLEGNRVDLEQVDGWGVFSERLDEQNRRKGEPMDVAPLYFWKRDGLKRKWEKEETIKTDLSDQSIPQYAGLTTTFGQEEEKGRVCLFSPHPELSTWEGGEVMEEPKGLQMIYQWVNGKELPGHNWWLLRRAVAWAAKVPEHDLPPIR